MFKQEVSTTISTASLISPPKNFFSFLLPQKKVKYGRGLKWSRLTKAVRINLNSKVVFEWPPYEKRDDYLAKGIYINGIENNHDKGLGNWFNWFLSNGEKSEQRDEGYVTKFPFMMPKDAKFKTVEFYTNSKCIFGFKFYDKNNSLVF